MAPRPRNNTITILRNAADQNNSRLFYLAPELRNRIYELVLENETVCVSSRTVDNPLARTKVPGILLSCKHTYVETLQIFFSKSIFELTSISKMLQWLRSIGPQNRALVSRIDFRLPSFSPNRLRQLLEDRSGYETNKLHQVRGALSRRQVTIPRGKLRLKAKYIGLYEYTWQLKKDHDGTVKYMMK